MTEHDEHDFELEMEAVRRAFDRAAADYDAHTPLQSTVRERLLEKLELVTLEPKVVLDAGCGTGRAIPALAKRFRKAELLALDLAPGMLREARKHKPWFRKLATLEGRLEAMPLGDDRVDVLFSSLAMQWLNDLDAALEEFKRVMRPGGLLTFATFGPDTLRELRSAWSEVDGFNHVNRFLDLHDVGDALVRAGFSEVVMDVEHFTLTYDSARDLMRDLKVIGAHNVTAGRSRGLMGRKKLAAVEQAYEAFRADFDGEQKLPATYEVVYGTAWLPEHAKQHRDHAMGVGREGEVSVSLDSLRSSLKKKTGDQ
ncbi:MAG: malonyl-ACP O-methyltransferase BioC [Gammaproteobacteria bacterium]|nr:malonyl-ACP O-methyltransferase BioC [Gammaproteobacteria bacterium]